MTTMSTIKSDHFRGHRNINEGQREGSDAILSELLAQAKADLLVLEAFKAGLQDPKDSVRLATAAALPACAAAGSGATKTLTADVVGALTVDGVAVALGDRILVKDQVVGADNGIYTVTTLGTGAVKWVLTRATDANISAEITSGMNLHVSEGSTLLDTHFALTTDDPIVLDTTALTFSIMFPVAHAATHIRGGSDEVDGDLLDVDWNPATYTPTVAAPATNADHLAAHLNGIDLLIGDHDARHILGGGDPIDGDRIDVDMTPTHYTPDAGVPEAGNVDHLAAHLGGIDNELGTLHAKTGAPTIRGFRATGGTLSANGSEDATVLGANLIQGQTFAQVTLGASLDIIAEEPGAPGNSLSVEVIDSAGVGGLAVSYAASKLTIDLDGDTPTEDQIAVAINTTGAWDGIFRADSGGGAAFGTVAETPLTGGGTGLGCKFYVGGGLCTPAGEAGGGATSTASLSETTCVIDVPDLTGLTPALAATTDDAAIWVESNGKTSNSLSKTLA